MCGEAIRAADGGAGVVCVLGNYGGDRMSFGQACDEFEDEGGKSATVIVDVRREIIHAACYIDELPVR